MNNGLEARLERLMETVNPQPATMQTIVIRCFGGIEDPATIRPPRYYLGRYASAVFIGGSEREQRRELRRLRKDRRFDLPDLGGMLLTDEGKTRKALAEGTEGEGGGGET